MSRFNKKFIELILGSGSLNKVLSRKLLNLSLRLWCSMKFMLTPYFPRIVSGERI